MLGWPGCATGGILGGIVWTAKNGAFRALLPFTVGSVAIISTHCRPITPPPPIPKEVR